jgi:two-component system phosphate regulon sensor histidine kinase PhoR
MRTIHINEISRTLENRASLLEIQFRQLVSAQDNITIDHLCKQYGRLTDTRITVIDVNGIVLGDSEKNPQLMENHKTRPEIVSALAGNTGTATRFSNTLQKNMKYVAYPVYVDDRVEGVIRTSLSVSDIDDTLNEFYQDVTIGGIIILLLAALISFVVFKRFTNPLGELQKGAERFANGQLDYKLQPGNTEEIASLSESMNRMAEDLNSRIRTIVEQSNEREAILTSMTEGILALDSKQKVVTLNKAISAFFELSPQDVLGKSIYEVIRITALHRLVDEATAGNTTIEKEIRLAGENELYFQAHGTPLTDISGNRIGLVLVFNDITRLKKLENIRRDFVANISHELKTPITAILGSAETLLETTIKKPEDNKRFLDMIIRHSDRLNSLVDDLLVLARLESEAGEGEIMLSRHKIVDVLESSIALCKTKSEASQVHLERECDSALEIDINFRQIEQAVTNLIDNAIKFSTPGGSIHLKVTLQANEIIISVEDQGCGIESQHLPRLFERFYRVDKGRSREMGGTGLGLAIVKHIALAHGGQVSVDSTPNKGSTFMIHLPFKP